MSQKVTLSSHTSPLSIQCTETGLHPRQSSLKAPRSATPSPASTGVSPHKHTATNRAIVIASVVLSVVVFAATLALGSWRCLAKRSRFHEKDNTQSADDEPSPAPISLEHDEPPTRLTSLSEPPFTSEEQLVITSEPQLPRTIGVQLEATLGQRNSAESDAPPAYDAL